MTASSAVMGWSDKTLPGRTTAPVTKTGKVDDSTETVISFEAICGAYSLINESCNSSGVKPEAWTSPTNCNEIFPSRRICWVVLRLGEPGKSIFTVSPSRRVIISECAGLAAAAAAGLSPVVAQPLNANNTARMSPQKDTAVRETKRTRLPLKFVFIGFFLLFFQK